MPDTRPELWGLCLDLHRSARCRFYRLWETASRTRSFCSSMAVRRIVSKDPFLRSTLSAAGRAKQTNKQTLPSLPTSGTAQSKSPEEETPSVDTPPRPPHPPPPPLPPPPFSHTPLPKESPFKDGPRGAVRKDRQRVEGEEGGGVGRSIVSKWATGEGSHVTGPRPRHVALAPRPGRARTHSAKWAAYLHEYHIRPDPAPEAAWCPAIDARHAPQ